jgi:hypothetical protein
MSALLAQIGDAQTDSIDYFGQTPPGDIPVVFAPGIICLSDRSEIKIVFSQNGDECLLVTGVGLLYAKSDNGHWSGFKTPDFIGGSRMGEPFFSPDGQKIFFSSDRDIWVSNRSNSRWTIPQSLNYPVNSSASEYHPTATLDGTLYFCSARDRTQSNYDIFKSEFINGNYSTVEKLDKVINSSNASDGAYDPYIAPDESYVIFTSILPDGYGRGDQYISYNRNGRWTNPKNLGSKINTNKTEYGSYVSPDGKYYLFSRPESDVIADVYWVSAGFVDSLKHTNFVPYLKSQIDEQKAVLYTRFTFQIPESVFVDDDGSETLTYTASLSNGKSLPSWLSFDSTTRTFSGTASTTGTSTIRVTVKDAASATVSGTFKLTVTLPTIDYFGQTPPGDSAVLFAPGVVSLPDRFENAITFSPDGKECCFETYDAVNWTWGTILYARYDNNQWSDFKPAVFLDSTTYFDILPMFSPDGQKFLFSSARPSKAYSYVDLWMCKRSEGSWGSPVNLGTSINEQNIDESYSSISLNGNIYFNKDNTNAIWFSACVNGVYSRAVKMKEPINSEYGAGAAFIAPDESYLIFSSSKPGGYGENDLYISYRKEDSTWTHPINLGSKINSPDREAAARISPDGKYLFFSRSKVKVYNDIYWVNTRFIDSLKQIVSAVGNKKQSAPEEFNLFCNYPNPFNPSTSIRYSLPEEARVKLEIFNFLGQKVAALIDDAQPAGSRMVTWNAENLSSGVYFCRFLAEGKKSFVKTLKLVLMK